VFLLALASYILKYKLVAAISIVGTVLILWLLLKRYSNKVRTLTHIWFAFLSFYPLFLIGSHLAKSMGDIDGLRASFFELTGLTGIPEAMLGSTSPPPAWVSSAIILSIAVLTVCIPILWIWDIKKKQTVYDYTGIPRWQKWLTVFLVFYGITYIHAMAFGWFLLGRFEVFLMFGLYPCPINLVLVAILAPLAPKVNKPMYIAVCLMAILGAFFNQTIGMSINLDAFAVSPVGVYGLIMLWRSTRKKTIE
ncbi:hypothetical protein KAS14_03220, partial [Candidatus Bathyarchaeota archaeon]|nr:hypothetical protein [Candidatus Bathyarchaeota archaeon]